MKSTPYLLAVLFILAGCDKPSQPPAPTAKLFEPQREALDKSKQVQQTVNQQAEQQKEATEQQTQ
jgi:uncharacterized lipoprotein YajG